MRFGILTLASLALAQAPPQFDVATIKSAAPSNDGRTHTTMSSDSATGKLNYGNVNLREMIAKAYKVQQYQREPRSIGEGWSSRPPPTP